MTNAANHSRNIPHPKNGRIIPYRLKFHFSKDIPRYWFHGSAAKTHILNGLTLMLPAAEKFFVRSVRSVLPRIKNLKIQEDAKAFVTQEMHHYNAHEAFFENLCEQGYPVEFWETFFYKLLDDIIEPNLSAEMKLAMTAGFEHFTSLIAEIGLEMDAMEGVHPEMRELFEWHGAEEILHKAVCYDVLNEIDNRLLTRASAMLLGSALLTTLLITIPLQLVAQDGKLFELKTWKDYLEFYFTKEAFLPKAFQKFLAYFHPNFHPWKDDTFPLAKKVLEKYNPENPQVNSQKIVAA